MNPENTSQSAHAWAKRFERFPAADMTVGQFCDAEGVTEAAYYYWRKKLHGNQSAGSQKAMAANQRAIQSNQRVTPKQLSNAKPRFVPVALADSSQPKPATVMAVELPGGIRIRFEVTGDPRQERA